MRNVDTLIEMEDILILIQYLYLSEEHTITVENSLGVPLEISMDDEGNVIQKNTQFPNVPGVKETYSIPIWFGIIDQLKEQPLKEMAGWNVGEKIKTRWDEINVLTKTNVVQNRMKQTLNKTKG